MFQMSTLVQPAVGEDWHIQQKSFTIPALSHQLTLIL